MALTQEEIKMLNQHSAMERTIWRYLITAALVYFLFIFIAFNYGRYYQGQYLITHSELPTAQRIMENCK